MSALLLIVALDPVVEICILIYGAAWRLYGLTTVTTVAAGADILFEQWTNLAIAVNFFEYHWNASSLLIRSKLIAQTHGLAFQPQRAWSAGLIVVSHTQANQRIAFS